MMSAFTPQELLLFALAALVLVLTPGPNMVYCVSRSLIQGPRAGLLSLAGVVAGFGVHLLDRLGRRRPEQVAVAFDRLAVLVGPGCGGRRLLLRGRRGVPTLGVARAARRTAGHRRLGGSSRGVVAGAEQSVEQTHGYASRIVCLEP